MESKNRRTLSLSEEEEEEVLFGMFGKSDLCEAGSFSLRKDRRTYPREFVEPFTCGIGLTGLLSKSWKERESGGRDEGKFLFKRATKSMTTRVLISQLSKVLSMRWE